MHLCTKIPQIMYSIFLGSCLQFLPIMHQLCAPFYRLYATYFCYT